MNPMPEMAERAEIDAVTARRWAQYEDALADDRAFQKRWMIPITTGSKRKPAFFQRIRRDQYVDVVAKQCTDAAERTGD